MVGVYENKSLIKTFITDEQTSESLPKIFFKILNEFEIKGLFYANGPGSFMAIKVNYVFLKTLQITKNLPFFACDGFAFNNSTPIKAIGNQWFVKEKNDILLKSDQAKNQKPFELPKFLNKEMFSKDAEPFYCLPAI